ncbi:hypothetical protein AKJ53_01655 [candidate division MSBL1 archaeon SCGC-AAA382F02]|uniref:ABC transporter domain-containing protein n=1 Tax=candidate division MSBL1 archaeon SCGC-AAA382F02 TaxID=1698282 RepID=A0A133VHQ7_9EURY|nr:hypothetical protein AKJ53_01655 [candidate division MSBL1 archaeon SCGC-AAA382F02]
MSALIRAEDLLVKFGDVIALNGFTAEVPRGVVGMLGPNGAGKSTFVRTVLGFVQPERGSVAFEGYEGGERGIAIRDEIGYMPEHECLVENVNAFDLVSYMGQLSGLDDKESVRRAHEALDFVGVDEERYREISSYSTGMRQRVKLAQAIVHDPEYLFLDEPTSGMDPGGKDKMLSLIENIGRAEKTVLICSHLLHEVERVSDYVLIIDRGRMLKSGDMADLLKGGEDLYKLEVRGEQDSIEDFLERIVEICDLVNVNRLEGRAELTIRRAESSGPVFALARNSGVQIRKYTPYKLTLEEAFIEAFESEGVDFHGD